jgi:hypothetical protein
LLHLSGNCDPRKPASLCYVTKVGPNTRKWFYNCQESVDDGCGFFLWDDKAGTRETHDVINNTRREYQAQIVNNGNAEQKPLDPLDGLIDFSEHENIPYSQTSSEFKVSNDTSSSRRPASSVYPLQSNDNGRWPDMHQ